MAIATIIIPIMQIVKSIKPKFGEPISPNQLCSHEPIARKDPMTDIVIPITCSSPIIFVIIPMIKRRIPSGRRNIPIIAVT